MRVLLFALMMVLLPLRAWVSDAMATGMAVAELSASSSLGVSAMKIRAMQAVETRTSSGFDAGNTLATAHRHAMAFSADTSPPPDHDALNEAAFDCAGHAGNSNDAAAGDACGACSACLTCHVAAVSGGVMGLNAFLLPQAAPRPTRGHFASADMALAQKPPIS